MPRTSASSIAFMGMALNQTVMRRERIRSGLSQAQVAEKLGIERSYVARLESGAKQPSVALLERIAELWRIPTHDLVAPVDAATQLAPVETPTELVVV
jgi:transcriptional regulator with XRE-family HTH domain